MGTEDRVLGPEMEAEGWKVVGGDWIYWLHGPSQRTVSVDGPFERRNAHVPTLFDKPVPPETPGYVVSCRKHDENGNPYEGEAFFIESYGEAVRLARAIRKSILDEGKRPAVADQLTLDDALEERR